VTFPIETAMAGISGLQYTRSLSRNGFSQVTAVFDDDVDIYFARNQVNERLREAKASLPPDSEPLMGPVTTGLGEIYMYAVEFQHPDGKDAPVSPGQPGWQSDGSYLTPENERLTTPLEKAAYLRTVQDWVIRPQLLGVRGVADLDSLGGYKKEYQVQPDPMKLVSYGLTFGDVIDALEKNNVSTGAGMVEYKGEAYTVRAAGRIADDRQIADIVVGMRGGTPIYVRDVATVGIGKELRTGTGSKDGQEVEPFSRRASRSAALPPSARPLSSRCTSPSSSSRASRGRCFTRWPSPSSSPWFRPSYCRSPSCRPWSPS
jgi:heavy metal efflux system protein